MTQITSLIELRATSILPLRQGQIAWYKLGDLHTSKNTALVVSTNTYTHRAIANEHIGTICHVLE